MAAAAVGTIASGALQADAAGNAADAQSQSSANSIAEQRRQYDQSRADQLPFLQTGTAANQKLAYLLGVGGKDSSSATNPYTLNDFLGYNARIAPAGYGQAGQQQDADIQYRNYQNGVYGNDPNAIAKQFGFSAPTASAAASEDPSQYGSLLKKFDQNDLNNDVVYNSGLQFGLNQGNEAINNRALQSGSFDSGGTLKALTKYANDYGSTKANDAYNRYNTDQSNVYNRLAGISGTGQTAAGQVQAAGTNMANSVSNSLTDQGNARSAGIIGGANAWGNVGSGLNNVYNNYNSNQNLQKLLNGNSTIYGTNGGGSNFQSYYQDGNGMG